MTGQIPPAPFSDDGGVCPIDKCPNSVCGGPHRVVRTDIGDELLKPDQSPIGTPIADMTEAEQQAHMEAEANAQRDDNG